MAMKAMKDVAKFKTYVANLRSAIDMAVEQPRTLYAVESFVSDSQTCPLLLIDDDPGSLVRALRETGTKVYGPGECLFDEKELKYTGPTGITDKLIKEALHAARLNFTPQRVKTLEAPAQANAAAKPQGAARPGPAATQAQARRDDAARLAPPLIERIDKLLPKFLPGDAEQKKFAELRKALNDAHASENADRVMSLVAPLEEKVQAMEDRVSTMTKEQAELAKGLDQFRKPFDAIHDAAAADDQALLTGDLNRIEKLRKALAFKDAKLALAKLGRHLAEAKKRTQEARASRIATAMKDARELLPGITTDEQAKLNAAHDAWQSVADEATKVKFEQAEQQFDTALEELLKPRRQLKEAEMLHAQVLALWEKVRYRVNGMDNKVSGYTNTYQTNSVPNRIKNSRKLYADLLQAAQAVDQKAQAQAVASQQFAALLSATEMEDQAATQYGDHHFSAGLVQRVWAEAKKKYRDNPPNGSVAGVHSLSDVEAALAVWKKPANGVLSNFHMPGRDGGRPQAKWEKDFTRPVVEANFCVRWRSQRVNVHVTVEPRSFVDKYGDDLDWSEVPQNVKAALGRR